MKGRTVVVSAAVALGCLASVAQAQIGSGWSQYSLGYAVQERGCGSVNGYTFSLSCSSENSTSCPAPCEQRAELRYDSYTASSHQFEGYVKVVSLDGTRVCVKQTFHGGSFMMLSVENGGRLYNTKTGATLGSFVIGQNVRVNSIHSGGILRTYINGTLKETQSAPIDGTEYYDKIGTYRTQSGKGPLTVQWSSVRFFRDGSPSGGSPTPTPTPVPAATATPTPTPVPAATATPTPGGSFSGYYRLTASHSGKAVVVQSASTANSANVIQYTYGGTATNDEWEVRGIGSGYYRVINRNSGKDLTVQSASTAEGANIFQYAYGGTTTNDEWAIVSVGSGYYRLTNRNSGKSAEVAGGGTSDSTNVDQRTYSGATYQQFQIVSVP